MNGTISIENAKILFRNFEGKPGKFNNAGNRNFCVLLDKDMAQQLKQDGWNIHWLKPKNPDEEEQAYMQVRINFDSKKPPRIMLMTSNNKTPVNELNVVILDWAEIQTVDLVINPSRWEVNGKSGIKAYLKAMYVTIVEDEFEGKYVNIPDSAKSVQEDDDQT